MSGISIKKVLEEQHKSQYRKVKRVTTPRRFETFSDGFNYPNDILQQWHSRLNPLKVYVSGYRVHHGAVGAGAALLGYLFDSPALMGLGTRLMIDDIADIDDWFSFQKR
jgi:hypothetical protein